MDCIGLKLLYHSGLSLKKPKPPSELDSTLRDSTEKFHLRFKLKLNFGNDEEAKRKNQITNAKRDGN